MSSYEDSNDTTISPNPRLAASYFQRAHDDLTCANILVKHHQANAIALAYYALYHAATALLILHGKTTKSHKRTIELLTLFGYDTTFIKEAKKIREQAQYAADPNTNDAETFLKNIAKEVARLEHA